MFSLILVSDFSLALLMFIVILHQELLGLEIYCFGAKVRCDLDKWTFLFCFVPKTVYGPIFFELFAKLFRIFRPRGNFFDGPIFFQNLADIAAISLVQKSSKSQPSSPFFGRLKFRGKFGPCELLQNFLCGYKTQIMPKTCQHPILHFEILNIKSDPAAQLKTNYLPCWPIHITTSTNGGSRK